MHKILIWGGRSQGRIVLEMIRSQNLGDVLVFFDGTLEKLEFAADVPFVSDAPTLRQILPEIDGYVVCIGGEFGYARVMTAGSLDKLGLSPVSVVHPRAFVDPTATVGPGILAMPGSLIHKFCKIGCHVIVNTGAIVDHECIIGDGVHLMGSCAIAGRVLVENFATVGTNATVLPDLTVGEGAIIGAGAVLTTNAEPNTVYAGVPARPIRKAARFFDGSALRQLAHDHDQSELGGCRDPQ